MKFPKRRGAPVVIDPDAENITEQLLAAIARIEQGMTDIQNTLDVLVAVMTMTESDESPSPAPVSVAHDARD